MKTRTYKEIVQRINQVKDAGHDWLGFEQSDLVIRLPWKQAKQFLNETAKEEEWKVAPRDRKTILKEMLDYMPFAWEKANDKRGLSAGRSMSHFQAWIWMAGDDLGNLSDYEYYGKDHLVKICKHYGWDSAQWDDGIRSNQ